MINRHLTTRVATDSGRISTDVKYTYYYYVRRYNTNKRKKLRRRYTHTHILTMYMRRERTLYVLIKH